MQIANWGRKRFIPNENNHINIWSNFELPVERSCNYITTEAVFPTWHLHVIPMGTVQQLCLGSPDTFLQFLNVQSYSFVVSHRQYHTVWQLICCNKLQLKFHYDSQCQWNPPKKLSDSKYGASLYFKEENINCYFLVN